MSVIVWEEHAPRVSKEMASKCQLRVGISASVGICKASRSVLRRVWCLDNSPASAAAAGRCEDWRMFAVVNGLRMVTSYAVGLSGSIPGGGGPGWTSLSAGR